MRALVAHHRVEMVDLIDELDRLAVPLDSGHIVGLDALKQASCLVDDHLFADPAGYQLGHQRRADGNTACSANGPDHCDAWPTVDTP